MTMSINTNVSAMIALQNLTKTNVQLSQAENRINTGLKIASSKDNAAYYGIAQNMRADVAGLSAATDSMNRAVSTVDLALAALDTVQELMLEVKAKAVAAADEGLDTESRALIVKDYNNLRAQMLQIAESAGFNGSNLIAAAPDSIKAVLNADASQVLSVAGVSLSSKLEFAALAEPTATTSGATAAQVKTQLVEIDDTIRNLTNMQATFGSAGRRLEAQLTFNTKLSDAAEAGIGNLVDADIAKESARLQALQIKQQLGLQALSIANAAPQSILALFR